MEETAQTSSSSPKVPWWRRAGWGICVGIALFAATEYVAALLLHRNPYLVKMPVGLLALVGMTAGLVIAGAAIRCVCHWMRPVGRLRTALSEIRDSQLAVEQLPEDLGALGVLRPVLLDLLRELRQQRAEISKLHHEMRQRVAQRTDALQRMVGSLRAQATHDPLTGLYNRRMLDESLGELVNRCRRDEQPLALMMIDVDDFKSLNDTLGHAAGDALLRSIGQLIRSTIRQQDCAFRYGGDEFVIALPHTGRAEAEALARRLTELVDALAKTLPLSRRPRLSVGIAALADLPATGGGGELVVAADRELYTAKGNRKRAQPSAA